MAAPALRLLHLVLKCDLYLVGHPDDKPSDLTCAFLQRDTLRLAKVTGGMQSIYVFCEEDVGDALRANGKEDATRDL